MRSLKEEHMIVVVFRSYLSTESEAEYKALASHVAPLAMAVPGYISHKSFVAEDGERATIVEYASEEPLKAWSRHPDHVQAKKLGRQSFYSSYKVQICSLLRERASQPHLHEAGRPSPYPSRAARRETFKSYDD